MENRMITKRLTQSILFTTLMVCSAHTAYGGGTTAGGGNVQLPDQVPLSHLARAVQRSKVVVTSWLSKQGKDFEEMKRLNTCGKPDEDKECAVLRKLFDSKPDIFEVLQKTEIETKIDGPCLDKDGHPNDGSMIGQKPGSVCISLSNIKTKLRADNFEGQIAALILHEISHLRGTTEPEADELQWYILNMDLDQIPFGKLQVEALVADSKMYEMKNMLTLWSQSLERKTSLFGSCREGNEVLNKYYGIREATDNFHFDFITPAQSRQFWGGYVKMKALWNYMCGQDDREPQDSRDMSASIYKFAFKGRPQITVAEYGGGFSEDANPDLILKNITAPAILVSEGQEVAQIFADVAKWYAKDMVNSEFKTYPEVQ